MHHSDVLDNEVVSHLHAAFKALPKKSKPRVLEDATHEWIPMSGIALIRDRDITCVALGTGMKCLPDSKIAKANGNILHDWHAEVLALRAFNRFLLDECLHLISGKQQSSSFLALRDGLGLEDGSVSQPFAIKDNVKIVMYCSEAPCGDASMELVMEAQEDATPWPITPTSENGDKLLLGRGSFAQLGIVRRKPARADSPWTSCKSCSDKLALKESTSLLSGLLSLLVTPQSAYLHRLIVPVQKYRKNAFERAFGKTGRMSHLAEKEWPRGYSFRPFDVATTDIDFEYSKNAVRGAERARGSNISAVWTPHHSETLINGTLAGRQQNDPRCRSVLSRRAMWEDVLQIIEHLQRPDLQSLKFIVSYNEFKNADPFQPRERVKADAKQRGLQGWHSNKDDDFEIEPSSPSSPVAGRM